MVWSQIMDYNAIFENFVYNELGSKHIYSQNFYSGSKSLWKVNYNLLKNITSTELKSLDYFLEAAYYNFNIRSLKILTLLYTDLMYVFFNENLKSSVLQDTIKLLCQKRCGLPIPIGSMHREFAISKTRDIRNFEITFDKVSNNSYKDTFQFQSKMTLNIDADKISYDVMMNDAVLGSLFKDWNRVKFTTRFIYGAANNQDDAVPIIQKDIFLAMMLATTLPITLEPSGFRCKEFNIQYDIETQSWIYKKNNSYKCNYPEIIERIVEYGGTGKISWSKIIN